MRDKGMQMRMFNRWASAVVAIGLLASSASAQEGSGFGKLDPSLPGGKTPEQIIAAFGARESVFRRARENYTYRQSVRIQTINDDSNKPDGEYNQVTDIGFDKSGRRTENVVNAPQNTLERVTLDQSDFEDLRIRLPLVLTTEDLPNYDVKYLGKQKVDELDTYVFQATPKVMEKNLRYYEGKVWVDQRDLEIVLISGKNVPDMKGHFSTPFTTYYEQIDDKNWFPTYTKADATVHLAADHDQAATDIHMRSTVKYTDYRQFRSSARVIYNGAEVKTDIDPKAKPENAPVAPTAPASLPAPTAPAPSPAPPK